jgi:Transposase IS200 like
VIREASDFRSQDIELLLGESVAEVNTAERKVETEQGQVIRFDRLLIGSGADPVVWCPKYRFRILKGAVQKSVTEIISRLCEWKKLEILEMNVLEDHVHLVPSVPPKFAVSEIIGFLKGKCAIKIFEGTWNSKNGVGVDTFGPNDIA